MRKTKKENDKYIERKLQDMIRGHESNFDTAGESIRVKVVDNKIVKTTYTEVVPTENELTPEPLAVETEITISELEVLMAAHAVDLDGKINIKTQVEALAARYGAHSIRDVTEDE